MLGQRYKLDFVLSCYQSSLEKVRLSLSEFAEEIKITESASQKTKAKDFLVSLITEEPTLIFDLCSQLGRIRSVKIDEI